MGLDFNPLLRGYLEYALEPCNSNPPPTDLPMRPDNMPYYRGPRFQEPPKAAAPADALHIQSLITEIVSSFGCGHNHLSNIPIQFSKFDSAPPLPWQATQTLLNFEFTSYARQAQQFDWTVYLFSNGHFLSTIQSHNLPFHIYLAFFLWCMLHWVMPRMLLQCINMTIEMTRNEGTCIPCRCLFWFAYLSWIT